jgi:mono/diheme cytochrome c family protein
LHFPAFANARFRRATDDGLLLILDAADKSFNLTSVKELLAGGATAVEEVWEPAAARPAARGWGIAIAAAVLLAALVPLGLIALARSRPSPVTPLHPILDMVRQPRFNTQSTNPMFADGRSMRPLLLGVVAREDLLFPSEGTVFDTSPKRERGTAKEQSSLALLASVDRSGARMFRDQAEYDRIMRGLRQAAKGKPEFVAGMPVPVDMDLMRRGRDRFNIYCAPCHGQGGYGDGMVARRAAEMQASGASSAAGWVAPTNYHTADLRARPVGYLFHVATAGIRTMPAYDKQISVFDRWAIVAYVKALQRSQDAKLGDVPAGVVGGE